MNSALSQIPLIAIVDDDASVCEAIQGLLRAFGFTTAAFSSAEEFLQFERVNDTACLITDVQLRGMSGLQLQDHLNKLSSRIPVIVVTAFPDNGGEALAAGAVCFLGKPVIKEELLTGIRSALNQTVNTHRSVTPFGKGVTRSTS
jgi:FixJ family two-component response regulator